MDASSIHLPSGADAALESAVSAFERPLGRYLIHLTGDRHLAQDLLQETFLRAYLHMGKLSGEDAVKPWLYRVATNLAMSSLRRRRLIAWLPLDWLKAERQPAQLADDVAERDRLYQALRALPADQASCFLLTRVEGLKSHEAAAVLGITPEAVRKRLSRAQEQLRQLLREEGQDAL